MVDWMGNGMREDILSQMKRILVLKQGSTEEFVRRCSEDYTKK
jgi:hypothetical protein